MQDKSNVEFYLSFSASLNTLSTLPTTSTFETFDAHRICVVPATYIARFTIADLQNLMAFYFV